MNEITNPAPVHNSDQQPSLAWFSLHSGKICLGPKPTQNTCEKLKSMGVTHVASVQTSEENAPVVRDTAQKAGLEWLWLPFVHSSPQASTDDIHLHQYLHELSTILEQGGRVYLHCDGSQQRCSLLFYALCHYCRIPSGCAYNALHSFGAKAANHLSRSKLQWAAQLGHAAPK